MERPNITTALDVLTQAADTVKVTDQTRRALALLAKYDALQSEALTLLDEILVNNEMRDTLSETGEKYEMALTALLSASIIDNIGQRQFNGI